MTAESPASQLPDPLGLTCEEFIDAYRASLGAARGRAEETYGRLFREGRLAQKNFCAKVGEVRRVLRSESPEGEVLKFVQGMGAAREWGFGTDGNPGNLRVSDFHRPTPALEMESVLIPMIGRKKRSYTLCVSSQVGCAMGCTFCETGQMGLIRSLTAAEIVGQWFAARHLVRDAAGGEVVPSNIVFMGMGEPMDNLDEVIRAIAVLTDHRGAAHPMSKITVSTVGRLDGITRLAAKVHEPGWHRLNLAISLNAPSDEVRSKIMPVNRAMPMAALREAILGWPVYGGAKICFEYVLIPGVNDAREHAEELAEWLRPVNTPRKRGMLNLIPYNPRRNSPWPAPEEARVDEFLAWLTALGVYCKRRRTKGREMMGACGQLGNEGIRKRKFVGVTASGSAR